MTMPEERTRAVLDAREFLERLARGELVGESPQALMTWSKALLRHYPENTHLRLASLALPAYWSSPEDAFTEAVPAKHLNFDGAPIATKTKQ